MGEIYTANTKSLCFLNSTLGKYPSYMSNVAMIANQLGRGLLAIRISITLAWGEQGDADRRWQDKSADVCRAHMVGWIEVLRRSQQSCAGASAAKFNSFNAASAIAGKILDQRLL